MSTKKIVICCDGTGNEINTHLSNVLKLYRMTADNDQQVRYYDPGVGTLGNDNPWAKYALRVSKVFGLATGKGLDENILDAYRFLIHTYEPGDEIYLFGFSRGAYTVRALAGLVYQIGILKPAQLNLAGYALTAYRRVPFQSNDESAWRFSRVTNARRAEIRFMGLWDTVSSIIAPRPDRLLHVTLQNLPHTAINPAVRVIRQAAAIDERRRMFRLHHWIPTECKPNPFLDDSAEQDFKQVWFAGSHSDVGGGYPEARSELAKHPLNWMIHEAVEHGLILEKDMYHRLVHGRDRNGSDRDYVGPDHSGPAHDSMSVFWRPLEYWPKRRRWQLWPERPTFLYWYLPLSEPRLIPPESQVHRSVLLRQRDLSDYQPINLPTSCEAVDHPADVFEVETPVAAREEPSLVLS